MDLTALELGLRNRQLLQVKCYLRIQVETFRYFLTEQLSQLSQASERVASLEKFFMHDWQNVINKIISVAAIHMTGDYSSKLFAVSLFRAMTQSCNQLVMIVSGASLAELDLEHVGGEGSFGQVFYRSRSLSSNSSSHSSSVQVFYADGHPMKTKTIKEKIFILLFRQINTINRNLLKVYNSHVDRYGSLAAGESLSEVMPGALTDSWLASAKAEKLTPKDVVDESPKADSKYSKFDSGSFGETLEEALVNRELPLLQCIARKSGGQWAESVIEWDSLVAKIAEHVANRIKSCEIRPETIEEIYSQLSQTGRSVLGLLFSLFVETCDASIRQKLLHIFFTRFDSLSSLQEAIETEMPNRRIDVASHLRLMSIIDLYLFCFRPKLNDTEKLEMSIQWIVNLPFRACIKSLIVPVLEEISVHSELFVDWQELNSQIYSEVFGHLQQFLIQKEDFALMINVEVLWHYLIDNQRHTQLVQWIESSFVSLPYCPRIEVPDDFGTAQRMVSYLINHGSELIRHQLITTLVLNPNFFHSYTLCDLAPDRFDFQAILGWMGRTGQIRFEQDSIEPLLSNSYFPLTNLVQYCVDNELYELLYLLYQRYPSHFVELNHEKLNLKCTQQLDFLQQLLLENDTSQGSLIFNKSLLIYNFLHGDPSVKGEKSLLKRLITSSDSIDLLLLILSFSNTMTFDHFATLLKEVNSQQSFWKALLLRYPLVHRSFELCTSKHFNPPQLSQPVCSTPLSGVNVRQANTMLDYVPMSMNSHTFDIYSLLQQSLPFVNINRFFRWQVKRRRSRSSLEDDSPPPSPRQSMPTIFENIELPHFSQKNLTEMYGLKAELTASYYLRNSRLVEAFLHCFSSSKRPLRDINEKMAMKAARKGALVAYSSIRQPSVFVACLLFQSLIRSYCINKDDSKRNSANDSQLSLLKDLTCEMEKTRLHLAIGKLIMEYSSDFLSLQGGQQQQSALASLLRKSHFNNDRNSGQKLLDLAAVAIERKYSGTQQQSRSTGKDTSKRLENSSIRMYLLFASKLSREDAVDRSKVAAMMEPCTLLHECFEWKPLFMFAAMHSLKPPLGFLAKCAREDNWLIFTIFAQIYEIPKDELQVALRGVDFNNQCIGEHLAKAFQSSRHVLASSYVDAETAKVRQAPTASRNQYYSRLFHEKRPQPSKSNEPRVEPTKSVASPTEYEASLFTFDQDSPENMSIYSPSTMSKLSDDNSTGLYVLFEHQLKPESSSKDFLQLVLGIYHNCVTFGARTNSVSYSVEAAFRSTLLYGSVSLSNPVLALLACSLKRVVSTPNSDNKPSLQRSRSSYSNNLSMCPLTYRFRFASYACWLLASASQVSKQSFIDYRLNLGNVRREQNYSPLVDCYLNWTPERSLQLIDVLTRKDAQNFINIRQGFKIFNVDIPILFTLLDFLIGFFIEKDYYPTNDLLREFQTLMMEYDEERFLRSKDIPPATGDDMDDDFFDETEAFNSNHASMRIFYSKQWIEKCSLLCITNSLILAKHFELGILLSHYNFVRIQDSFSSETHQVPDIRRFYLFSQCLTKFPNFTLPIGKLLTVDTSSGANEDSQYAIVLRKLILDLQELGYFDEARNIVNLLPKTNTNEFVINEWMLKAKNANESDSSVTVQAESSVNPDVNVTLAKIDLTFWENCWAQVTKLDPSMHSAFKVMERFVQQLEPSQVLIKCFVLLKCLLAVESILRDHLENESSEPRWFIGSPDDTTISSTCNTGNLDLIEDYYQFEVSLWKSVIECEFLKQKSHYEMNGESSETSDPVPTMDSNESSFESAWTTIWKEVVAYLKSSTLSTRIIPGLSSRHSHQLGSMLKKRPKPVTLEASRQEALSHVIAKLLDSFCFEKAFEVAQLFRYDHDDFEIIRACDEAARGILKDLSDAPLALQLKIQHSDCPSSSHSIVIVPQFSAYKLSAEQKKAISLVQTFTNFATIGRTFCQYILLFCKLSYILQKSYSDLKDSAYTSAQIFERLLSSNEVNPMDPKKGDSSSADLFDDSESVLEASGGSGNESSQKAHSLYIDKYNEAIQCARELIRIAAEVDDRLDTEEKIADLLTRYVQGNVQRLVQQQFKDSIDSEIELDRSVLEFYSARFQVLLRLLREPSILGHNLIDVCRKMKSNFEDTWERYLKRNLDSPGSDSSEKSAEFVNAQRRHYVLLVELFIRAHDSFTSECDVHGIALVLRKARLLITQELKQSRYFHLILRLLTGIGRYSEMTYCFDLFRECDRFEMILSKRVQRTPQLRIALLNYLKTTERMNELLPLVAIRFFLHRETADHHRARAERRLLEFRPQLNSSGTQIPQLMRSNASGLSLSSKRISSASLTDYASSSPVGSMPLPSFVSNSLMYSTWRDQLETIMYEFQEAEIHYTKANSHTNAEYCSRKAQLVALQIANLQRVKPADQATSSSNAPPPSVQLVINLDATQVRDFIHQCSNFYEALIVSKAYPEVTVDWADALFQHAILGSQTNYLTQFVTTQPLTISMLEKLVKRYEQLCSAFRQQSQLSSSHHSARSLHHQSAMSNSPSTPSFLALLGQIRSDTELNRIHRVLEQLLEQVLCLEELPCQRCDLKDKYTLARQFNSPRILKRLLEEDSENSAYLLDLLRTQRL